MGDTKDLTPEELIDAIAEMLMKASPNRGDVFAVIWRKDPGHFMIRTNARSERFDDFLKWTMRARDEAGEDGDLESVACDPATRH